MSNKALWLALLMCAGCRRSQTVGQACDLTVAARFDQQVVNLKARECATGLCLKPEVEPLADLPTSNTGATCTDECNSDSDCDGELRSPSDALDTRCKGGFACRVPFLVGPLCCKRYCVCKDFLNPTEAPEAAVCQAPDARGACVSAAGSATAAGVGQQVVLHTTLTPTRKLDLVFMIDDSPSMAPKVSKLVRQFPGLIEELKDPTDGRYPDLRVAIVDSDLGTGAAYPTGPCGPTASPEATNRFGDLGNFQMRGAVGCGAQVEALWLEHANGTPLTYSQGVDMSQVFGCLAGNLGGLGCGQEHQLQSLEFALALPSLHQSQSGGLQNTFLRPDALLGLVIVSDEDDCSAATNDGMFGTKPELSGESTSLRCATRAHQCGGVNLTDAPPGYPTSAPFEARFADCAARTDSCPNATDGTGGTDTRGPTACSPLKDVHRLAQEIKALKTDPDSQIIVSGIFGWPRHDVPDATYKIGLVPGPGSEDMDGQQGPLWDYWPVCFDPDHEPKDPTRFDAEAWAWGARGGLRIAAFIDEFGPSGHKLSICEPSFREAMAPLHGTLGAKLQNLCIDAKLMDVDPLSPGVQPDCRAVYRVPEVDAEGEVSWTLSPLPRCAPGATADTIPSDCWRLLVDTSKCPVNGQLLGVLRSTATDSPLPAGTKIGMYCWACPDLMSRPGCES